jgi:thiol:disulfide interchange protein DsbA
VRRALLRALGFAAALALCGAAAGQEPVRVRENLEYRVIPQQPVATGQRIEVIDFFWYGCPYCSDLQPALEEWRLHRKPADVELRRVPAILRESWAPHARIYYTLEALGEVERLHQKVYHAYHVEKLHLGKPEVAAQWAVANGIERGRWLEAYHSAEVEEKVQRAARLTRAYQVRGTPSLVVDGRYLTSSAMTETLREVVSVLEELIRLARRARSGG